MALPQPGQYETLDSALKSVDNPRSAAIMIRIQASRRKIRVESAKKLNRLAETCVQHRTKNNQMRRRLSTALIVTAPFIFFSIILSGCATYAADDYEAIFIGDFKVVKQDEHRPLQTATIKFDKDRNGYIALQAPGQDSYTSVHLWACRSFDAHRDGHNVQQVRCGGDDGQSYFFNKEADSNGSPMDSAKIDLSIGRANWYWHHYALTRVVPTS
ncbi:hypothetical protein [Paraburkholderia sp.]|uniref:hypothetical protein n=1 Tax=Paraburkholderia sp. TaxID=1926495 RepID=UPI0025D3F70F|nr:hypothetical protein [Paraburkholderia sp.]